MILGETKQHVTYSRWRKGRKELCNTTRKLYHLRCDNCNAEFYRDSKQFDKRSSAHVCTNCDQKRFAQRQSATLRYFNKYDASSGKTI